jgi:hypothetical protein
MFAGHRVCQECFGGQAKALVGGKLMESARGATVARRVPSIEDRFHLDLKTLIVSIMIGRDRRMPVVVSSFAGGLLALFKGFLESRALILSH